MNSVMRHGEYREHQDERQTGRKRPGGAGSATWPELIETAQAYRIATEYHDWQGRRVEVPAETLIAVLAAFGVDAHDSASCREALRELTERQFRPLPPCVVV